MTRIVPLIRAAVFTPLIKWLVEQGRQVSPILEAADFAYLTLCHPNDPVPIWSGVALLREIARREGPDVFCRLVSTESVAEVPLLAAMVQGTKTPRESFRRLSRMMPAHCTHEHISVAGGPHEVILQDSWTLRFDDEALHLIQQYVAALVQKLCALTAKRGSLLSCVEIVPHPTAGLDHLRLWFETSISAAPGRSLAVRIRNDVADSLYLKDMIGPTDLPSSEEWSVLIGALSLTDSVALTMKAMLKDGAPNLDRIAVATGGMSRRTLQRRLADEGTSISHLLDIVRRETVLDALASSDGLLQDLAPMHGYSDTSAMNRAVRRWTGSTPGRLRRRRALQSSILGVEEPVRD